MRYYSQLKSVQASVLKKAEGGDINATDCWEAEMVQLER